jgi:division protein CdvB (Snf7/Vps24/ESCRT-III family)
MGFNSLSNLVSKSRLSLWERIYRRINPIPIRRQIINTLIRLNVQKSRLSHTRTKLEAMAGSIHNCIVEAKVKGDLEKLKMYISEYVEVRKICKLIVKTELVLDVALSRLETIRSFSDVVAAIIPLQTLVDTLKPEFVDSIPKLSTKLSEVFENIKSVMIEIAEASSSLYREAIVNEAEKILREASVVADQRIKEKLPEIPIESLALEINES